MPILKDSQHEAFCQALAKGKSQTDAYLAAGYRVSSTATAKVNASRLLTKANVHARMMELKQRNAEKLHITAETMAHEFDDAAAFAHEMGQPGPFVSAKAYKSRLFGLIQTNSKLHARVDARIDLSGVPDDHLEALERAFAHLHGGGTGADRGPDKP